MMIICSTQNYVEQFKKVFFKQLLLQKKKAIKIVMKIKRLKIIKIKLNCCYIMTVEFNQKTRDFCYFFKELIDK